MRRGGAAKSGGGALPGFDGRDGTGRRAAARAFGQVAASARRSGRKTSARACDAMIAAIAVANGLPLYTCNPADFSGIDGQTVVAVVHPDGPSAGR